MTDTKPISLYPTLAKYVSARQREFDQIPQSRTEELGQVASYIRKSIERGKIAKLTFICTHNSRRSHLSQIWAQVAAYIYRVHPVESYSGGTEATAFNPRAVASLKRSGLEIDTDDGAATNPTYRVRHSDEARSQDCFSKVFDQAPNPTAEYCAVMTCSQADDACPVVMGCELRAPIRYEDPKAFDDTPLETVSYDERSRQICREMLFMLSIV